MADELPLNCHTPAIAEYDSTIDPQEHLSRFKNAVLLHRYIDGIKCQVFVTIFAQAAQQWFNQLPPAMIESFQEFHSLFLHQFATSRKHRKDRIKPLLNPQEGRRALEGVPPTFQHSRLGGPNGDPGSGQRLLRKGLLDGDFFKSLAKKPATKLDALLSREANILIWRIPRHPSGKDEEKRGRKTKMKVPPKSQG
ncbi:UNVERIFIED_CONTAM: hypothetical protein Sangu_0955300 [Sesamum angustifolium]|uniref:Retrotransposon gag domain-containing protein n=1 Tax=Sesamum angustifolium TaxID=2727405 RepID=A0AAW2PF34_9LAMI